MMEYTNKYYDGIYQQILEHAYAVYQKELK